MTEKIENTPPSTERQALANHAHALQEDITRQDESKWPALRHHLVTTLKFDETTIDSLKRMKRCYANSFGQLVSVQFSPTDAGPKETGKIVYDMRDRETGFYAEYGIGFAPISYSPKAKREETIVAMDFFDAFAAFSRQKKIKKKRDIFVVGRKQNRDKVALFQHLAASTKLLIYKSTDSLGKKFASWIRSIFPKIVEIDPQKELEQISRADAEQSPIDPS